jgi:hypothetical protein
MAQSLARRKTHSSSETTAAASAGGNARGRASKTGVNGCDRGSNSIPTGL